MPKLSLVINKNDTAKHIYQTLGMPETLDCLVNSGLFDVTYHTEKISTTKGERGTVVYFQGKKIYIDFWEYNNPTWTLPVYNAGFDLIIKLQHRNSLKNNDELERVCQRKHILTNGLTVEDRQKYRDKMTTWTFFCSKMMLPFWGKEDLIQPIPIERLGFFCGKTWKSRGAMLKKFERDGIEVIHSSQETPGQKPLTDEAYLYKMKSSKLGLVLGGKASHLTECKNRREIDFMMLSKPLCINYKPSYYNPLVEGKHYIYIDEKIDLKNLENQYNIDEIARNGWQWYQDNASPSGLVKTFLQIMREKLNVGTETA